MQCVIEFRPGNQKHVLCVEMAQYDCMHSMLKWLNIFFTQIWKLTPYWNSHILAWTLHVKIVLQNPAAPIRYICLAHKPPPPHN